MAKFTFDGPNKKIIMNNDAVLNGMTTFSVSELWTEWCDWLVIGDNLKYAPALESLMVPLNATEFVGPYLFLRNDLGWRGLPPAVNPCSIIIEGSFFGKDPSLPVMENLEAQATDLVINRSVLTNTISVDGGSSSSFPTANEIANAVLYKLNLTTIPVDLHKIKGQDLVGSGTENDPWGPA